LKNLGLFLVVFLPCVALVSMVLAAVLGDRVPSSPQWQAGWNPLLWLIMTAPWLLPTAFVVPLLHMLARTLRRRLPSMQARLTFVAASTLLFLLAVLALWGVANLTVSFALPVVVSAAAYGFVFRIPLPGARIH
jgi:hypothetical protein